MEIPLAINTLFGVCLITAPAASKGNTESSHLNVKDCVYLADSSCMSGVKIATLATSGRLTARITTMTAISEALKLEAGLICDSQLQTASCN